MDQETRRLRPEHILMAAMLFLMALITFVNVLSRYFFHFSLAATEEITINLFVWMTVIGIGLAFERGGQLGMVTLYNIFPAKMKRRVIWLSTLLAAALFVVVDMYTIQAIYDEITMFQAMSAALGIPVWIYYAGVPILSLFVFKGIVLDARTRLRALDLYEHHKTISGK
jgi:TRAP-type C4-dicarboxylate transport system permease small subunit